MNTLSTVYLETTIPSFLTARPSNNLVVAGKQETTRQWWETRRGKYRLLISQFVLDEAGAGDPEAAKRRLDIIADLETLEIDEEVLSLAERIVEAGLIPVKSSTDAAHVAVAARHGVDFLLTWNCAHIANAEILARANFVVARAGYDLPTICTPDELFGGGNDE